MQVSNRLIHFIPVPSLDSLDHIEIASDFAAKKIMSRLRSEERSKLKSLLSACEDDSRLGPLVGQLFEAHCIARFTDKATTLVFNIDKTLQAGSSFSSVPNHGLPSPGVVCLGAPIVLCMCVVFLLRPSVRQPSLKAE